MPQTFFERIFSSWLFSPFRDSDRGLQLLQWLLPLVLFLIASMYEIGEHGMGIWGGQREPFSFNMNAEIFIFGIVGPIATALAVGYVRYLLKKEMDIRLQLEEINQQLEEIVARRTQALEARNQELAQANAELQQLDQLKSDFVSLVSHELRGPLTTLNGGLELALTRKDELSSESRAILETLAVESERLTRFVSEILDVSRLGAGKLRLNLGPVAVRPLLMRSVEVVCEPQGREVVLNVPNDLPPVWADEIYLEKIIANLLNNAVKYSPADQPIRLCALLENDHLCISVEDYGPGIPKSAQETIFERFHRLERGDRISQKGWGLGLYFAKALTEAQGGRIHLQSPARPSKTNPGAVFSIELPVTAEVPEDA